jgi:hypothetical protein
MMWHDPRSRTDPMTAVPFDTLKLARQLRDKAGFTPEHAEAAAEALAEAVGGAELVTKSDMTVALRDLEQRLTIKLGGMLVVAVGIIPAALRYFPPHP